MYNYLKNLFLFVKFLLRNDREINDKSSCREEVGILITRWPAPTLVYFNMAIAILIKLSGYTPIIIYDDLTNGILKRNLFVEFEAFLLLKILKSAKIVYLSSLRDLDLDNSDIDELRELSKINTYYKEKTTVPSCKSSQTYNVFFNHLSVVSPKINRLFSCRYFERLIIPGGVYGHTGLYVYLGKKHGVRVASYDSGPNIFIIGTDNVAAYLRDIPRVLADVTDHCYFKKEIDIAKDEFEKRRHGKDAWQYQSVPYSGDAAGEVFDVIMPLNVEIDAASLIRSSNFENMYYWLTETVDFLLKNTNARIAIKEHPIIYNRTDILKNSMLNHLAGNPMAKYFSRDDKVNTYQLIDKSRIVLPYTSTVGIEAAIMGKCVIVESGVYYTDLPFVIKSDSKNDYFENILMYLKTARELPNDEKNLALLCYYFTQKCNFLNTHFTPQPSDFKEWSNKTIQELLDDEKIKIILSSFFDGIPLAKLNHENIISKQNVSKNN